MKVNEWGIPLDESVEFKLPKESLEEQLDEVRKNELRKVEVKKQNDADKIYENYEKNFKKFEDLSSDFRSAAVNTKQTEADDAPAQKDPEAEANKFDEYIDRDLLQRFSEGLLTILGELALEGQIPSIEDPNDAKNALLSAIRHLSSQKSVVASQSRLFARYGAKQFVKKQGQKLKKSLA